MPPAQASAYFPPLDRCLAGEDRLISWKTAYRALCDSNSAAESGTLEAFLTDPESVDILSAALDPFRQPGDKTKAEFETKTAPIHVSQSANGDYKLEELKKDALWLSDKLNVEELVALRVVIVEWQQRSEDQLLVTAAANGGAGSGTPVDLGASTLGRSTLSVSAFVNGTARSNLDFDKEDVRRQRQLLIFLEERSHVLKISTELVNHEAIRRPNARTGQSWIDDLAKRVSVDQCATDDLTTHEAFCASCVEAIDGMTMKLADRSKWLEVFRSDDAKIFHFEAAILADITSALRLLLANLYLLKGVPSAHAVSSWFRTMARLNFFQDVMPSATLPNVDALQSLASLISLTILQVPETLNRIQESGRSMLEGGVQYPRLEGQNAYFLNDTCVKDVNLILYNAAQANTILAAPAMFAWSMVTSVIRDIAKMLQDIREQQRASLEEESSDGEPISRRRASRRDSRDEMTAFEKQYELLQQDTDMEAEAREDAPAFLAHASVDRMAVFSIISRLSTAITVSFGSEIGEATSFSGRDALLQLINEGMAIVAYGDEVMDAVLTVLSPDVWGRSTKLDVHLADKFLSNETNFRAAIRDQALERYPFELSPMLRLFTALSSSSTQRPAGSPDLVQMLEHLKTLTVMVPEQFRAYTLENEDENINSMMLTESLPMFVSKQALAFYGHDYMGRPALTMGSGEENGSAVLAVPTGVAGIIVKESRPLVFKLEHPHSGLEYLGLLLSTVLPNSELLPAPVEADLDRAKAAEIITLISALLTASIRQHQGAQEARFVLERLESALPEEHDIISVIADALETELLAHLDQSIQDGSLELLIACADFFDLLTKIKPERVWSILSRSGLLGLVGGANALAAVVSGTETQSGRFRFLSACVKMYSHLIDDAIAGLVKRRARFNKATNRFDSPMSSQDATPERMMGSVLGAYQTTMIDAWQSLAEWRFLVRCEKSEITSLILSSFERLLKTAYGIDQTEKGISALLMPSAATLLDKFAAESGDGMGLQTLGAAFDAGLGVSEVGLTTQERQCLIAQVNAASGFLTTLIRTARMVDESQRRAYLLSAQLLKLMPVFASLLPTDHAFKRGLSDLLAELVQAVNNSPSSDPPSLLGQLSAEAGKSFLAVISQLDRPLRDLRTECAVWSFLSAVMSSKQQWFAIYLLTGSLPKDRLKETISSKSKTLLAYALDQLSTLTTQPPERAMAMLKFVASAQNTWIWATNEVRNHPDFLKNTVVWLNDLQPPSRAPNMAEETLSASEHQMAAYLCDILAVNLHASLETGDKTVLKLLTPKLAFLRKHAGAVDSYNRSLHRNLSENFSRKFAGCEVTDFKRTAANPAPHGRDFFYDLELAKRVIGHEMAWDGAGLNGRQQGFADEFGRANVNLSLVEAQRSLLQSWRVLSTTLCEFVNQDANLRLELAQTAERCLSANVETNLDVPGMDEVVNTRAEMAFVIISKLVAVKAENAAMKDLLSACWDLVRSSPVDFDVATAAQDLRYYRTLLQVLYLAIQPHVYMKSESTPSTANQRETRATDETRIHYIDSEVAACLVEVVSKVVAPGFRALCGNLHTSIDLATLADFALLTALLQALLSVRGIEAVHPQIADVVASSSLVRGALSLYSWADQLAEVMDQDPVYGEVSIMFLLALSTIRPVAEQMALEGVLIQLSSANLSNYFRKPGGKTPFDEPRRMFTIWTEGFLPLILNLLDAVGPPIAADISAFLNQFSEQLIRAETALENREPSPRLPHAGAITLGLVSEAHSLCLTGLILESDTLRGAAEGINPADVPKLEFDFRKMKDDAAGLMRQKTSLASRIVAVGEREEVWKATDGGAGADSVLMGKVVREVVELLGAFGE